MIKPENRSLKIILFIVTYICIYLTVCSLDSGFGYYANHYISKIFSFRIYYINIMIPAYFIGYISFLIYTFCLWSEPIKIKREKIYIKGIFICFLMAIIAFITYLRVNIFLTVVVFPFLFYYCFMELISVLFDYMKYKNKFIIFEFYNQFEITTPIGFLATVLFSLISMVFIYELFLRDGKQIQLILLYFILTASITSLIYYFSEYTKIETQKYEKILIEKIKSERFKIDLITNVSHDIKTPLTSIINYVDLINKINTNDSEINEYTNILAKKSQRLKILIEDLLEASKAGTGNISVSLEEVNLIELLGQISGEFDDLFLNRKLNLVKEFSNGDIFIIADRKHIWRVFENIFNNVVKYSMENTRIYVSIKQDTINTEFSLKNISREQLNITPEELTQQFTRGDRARHTEGTGLGLYIAKSLTEAMGGKFSINISGDLFEIKIILKNS